MKLIGLLEGGCGLGMILGPFMGTILFELLGYDGMLMSFGGLFLILVPILWLYLPAILDTKTSMTVEEPNLNESTGQTNFIEL